MQTYQSKCMCCKYAYSSISKEANSMYIKFLHENNYKAVICFKLLKFSNLSFYFIGTHVRNLQ